MGSSRPPPHRPEQRAAGPLHPATQRETEHYEISALIEENTQLRELVIHLSKLVIKNVVDRK